MSSLRYWIKRVREKWDYIYEFYILDMIYYKRMVRKIAPALADCRAGRFYDGDGNKIGDW